MNLCNITYCYKQAAFNGYCIPHHDVISIKATEENQKCSTTGCDKACWSQGLCFYHCDKHYKINRFIRLKEALNRIGNDKFKRK